MNFPKDLLYAKTHEWVKIEGDEAAVGLTDYAQDALGDLVFVNLPEVGDTFAAGDTLADVESVKAVSDVYCPITGTVSEINEELLDAPEEINKDPYGAWFVKLSGVADTDDLMDAADYEKFVEEEKNKED